MSALDQQNLQTAVHAALVDWGKPTEKGLETFAQLLLLQKQYQSTEDNFILALRHAVDHLILDNIKQMAQQDETAAKVLERRFIDGQITRQVAQEMHASPDQVNRWQRAAIVHLTQLIYQQEQQLRTETIQAIEATLPPPPYTQFFGYDNTQQKISAQLTQKEAPWLIALTGIGGIGKTSLADLVVRQLLPTMSYQQICWLRVNTQQLSGTPLPAEAGYQQLLTDLSQKLWPDHPANDLLSVLENKIRRTLKATPHLIVVDNLESSSPSDLLLPTICLFCQSQPFFANQPRTAD